MAVDLQTLADSSITEDTKSNLLSNMELKTDFFKHIEILASVHMPGAPKWRMNRRLHMNRCLDIVGLV